MNKHQLYVIIYSILSLPFSVTLICISGAMYKGVPPKSTSRFSLEFTAKPKSDNLITNSSSLFKIKTF